MKCKAFNLKTGSNQQNFDPRQPRKYCFYRVLRALFYIENDAEIYPAHSTRKVAEKGFKIAFMMNKIAMIISFEIILEK